MKQVPLWLLQSADFSDVLAPSKPNRISREARHDHDRSTSSGIFGPRCLNPKQMALSRRRASFYQDGAGG